MKRFVSRILLGCCSMTLAAPSFGALLNPVATTGHDQDIVFEAGLTAGQVGANGELGSRQFFEAGVFADGLPRSVPTYLAASGNSINYDFQPFEQNNILKFDSASAATPKTLTLTTPTAYRQLAIVHAGGSLATATEFASVSYQINYSGGATQTGTIMSPDWGAVPTLPTGTERLITADRTTANATMAPIASDNNTTANRWAIYLSEIATIQGQSIVSVHFGPITLNDADGLLNSGDDVAIFGLSGAVVPEPATWALAGVGGALIGAWRRRRVAA